MLDDKQMEACNHFRGPCLTLAGPGSGKTTVLTHRIVNLIEKYGVTPSKILVITFTKDSAMEMQARFQGLIRDGGQEATVAFGTFHSVFFQILRTSDHYSVDDILTGKTRNQMLSEVIRTCGIQGMDEGKTDILLGELGLLANTSCCDRPEDSGLVSAVVSVDDFYKIARAYDARKKKDHLLDFDDMISRTLELLGGRKDVLQYWQSRFDQILVDEAQDMNPAQFSILRMLGEKHRNIFVVGDDDQSIYGFRGADPSILKEFTRVYPDCHQIMLNRNYRSDQRIVMAAAAMITHNIDRFPKEITAFQEKMGRVVFRKCRTDIEQAQMVSGGLERYMRGVPEGEEVSVAILFRNRRQIHPVIAELSLRGIPYYMREKLVSVYEHWIMKDIIAYMAIAAGSKERKYYLRICNRPNRYIHRESLDMEEVTWKRWLSYYDGKGWMQDRIIQMQAQLQRISSMSPYQAVVYIRKGMGYEKFACSYAGKKGVEAEEVNIIFDTLLHLAQKAGGYGPHALMHWVKEMEQGQEEVKNSGQMVVSKKGVGLYTFHGSKGLEFDRVYIIDCNEQVTPSSRATTEKALEEERRMFYVACTRAKHELYLYSVASEGSRPLAPSRFLEEMVISNDQKEGDGTISCCHNPFQQAGGSSDLPSGTLPQ